MDQISHPRANYCRDIVLKNPKIILETKIRKQDFPYISTHPKWSLDSIFTLSFFYKICLLSAKKEFKGIVPLG